MAGALDQRWWYAMMSSLPNSRRLPIIHTSERWILEERR